MRPHEAPAGRTLHAIAIALSCVAMPAIGWGADCLADMRTAASGPLGYKSRSQRCEGLLQRFVSSSDSIDLIGYHAGNVEVRKLAKSSVTVTAIGAGGHEPVALRALSLTSRGRYQMDRENGHVGEPFDWSPEVAGQLIGSGPPATLDPAKVGLLACSLRCADQPETVYWPVAMGALPGGPLNLALLFRAGVKATRLSLQLERDGKTTVVPAGGLALLPDAVTTIALPASLPTGLYKIVLDGRNDGNGAPLAAFVGTIFVPKAGTP